MDINLTEQYKMNNDYYNNEKLEYEFHDIQKCDECPLRHQVDKVSEDEHCNYNQNVSFDVIEHENTQSEKWFDSAIESCRNIFYNKLDDYGPSWRIMRPASLTDQIYIKASRIRYLEENHVSLVGDGILTEFRAIVNYGVIALIQLQYGYSDKDNMTSDTAKKLYNQYMENTFNLMVKKNHDYNEAWKLMRLNSYTDFILMKILRIMEIESHGGKTKVSEPIDSNYYDIINYAIFGIIKLTEPEWKEEVAGFAEIN